jgi:type VI secretion system protein ImpF
MNIEVTIEGSEVTDRRLRFHIEGQMRLDPAPEEISFDTVLELTSGEYRMK